MLDIRKLILAIEAESAIHLTFGACDSTVSAEQRLVFVERIRLARRPTARIFVGALFAIGERIIRQGAGQTRRGCGRCRRDEVIVITALSDTTLRLHFCELFKRIACLFNFRRRGRVTRFHASKIFVVEEIFRRARYCAKISILVARVVAIDSLAVYFRHLSVTDREQRFGNLEDGFDNAIGDIGVRDDIAFFNPVAVNDDLTNQVLIMRTAAAVLV